MLLEFLLSLIPGITFLIYAITIRYYWKQILCGIIVIVGFIYGVYLHDTAKQTSNHITDQYLPVLHFDGVKQTLLVKNDTGHAIKQILFIGKEFACKNDTMPDSVYTVEQAEAASCFPRLNYAHSRVETLYSSLKEESMEVIQPGEEFSLHNSDGDTGGTFYSAMPEGYHQVYAIPKVDSAKIVGEE